MTINAISRSLQVRELIAGQEKLYRSARTWSAPDEPAFLQGDDPVVDGRGRHVEVALHVGLSGRDTVDFSVVIDEGQVLALGVRGATTQLESAPNWSAGGSPPGNAQKKCFYCKRADDSVVNVPPGVWLCKKCRKHLRRGRRAEKHRKEMASYYNALTHPEFRGLKGIRK